MKILAKLINLMNGKKTWSGLAILAISTILYGLGGSADDVAAFKELIKALQNPEVAAALAGVVTTIIGMAHKASKSAEKD